MRKFLTCALCFVPTLAGAITLYYDTTGECDGWWLGTVQTGCPASNLRVTKFHPTTAASKVFGGIVIGDEAVVESDGTLKSFNSLSESTKSAIRAATSLDVYKQEWDAGDTVTVNFDARGGKMSGATSRQMGRGATLPTITGLRGDGASFSGWVDNSGNKVVSVSTNAAGTQNLTATYTCGTGTSPNANGVCVPDGPIYDENGEQIPRDEIDPCSFVAVGGTYTHPDSVLPPSDECFERQRIKVHLIDRPSDSSLNVTNGNNGMVLECNRVWCFIPEGVSPSSGLTYIGLSNGSEQNPIVSQPGDVVAKIALPRNDDYIFRGYYRDLSNQGDLITNKGETRGRAVGNFFPKSNTDWSAANNQPVMYMSIYNSAVAWYGDQDIPGFHDEGLNEITLYGAWAKKCANHGEHSTDSETCELQKGTRLGTDQNGLEAGDVFYKTSCPNGYHVTSGAGTYSPTCGLDEDDINMSYAFTNQYGDVVSCATSITNTCTWTNTTGGNVSLLNKTDFNNACGTRYALRWLKVNGTWYSPNKSVSCTTNILGTGNPVNVTGYVCDVCQPTTHGTCVNISRDQTINFDPHGAGTYTGYLWGENGGTVNPTPACQVMKCGADNSEYTYLWKNPMTGIRSCEKPCSDGYAAYPNETNGNMQCLSPYEQCIVACQQDPSKCGSNPETYCQTSTFSCPQPSLTLADGMTISNGVLGQSNTCTYTLGCSNSNAISGSVLVNSIGVAVVEKTIQCSGDACSNTANLQSQLNGYSCFSCPVHSGGGVAYNTNLTIGQEYMTTIDDMGEIKDINDMQIDPEELRGKVIACNYKVWCRTGTYEQNDTNVLGVATCTSDSNQYTRCYVPMGQSYVYTNLNDSINSYLDDDGHCKGAETTECPNVSSVNWPAGLDVESPIVSGSTCSYRLSCPNSKVLVEYYGLSSQTLVSDGEYSLQCTGTSGSAPCTSSGLASAATIYSCEDWFCRSGSEIETVSGSGIQIELKNTNATSQSCTYEVSCANSSQNLTSESGRVDGDTMTHTCTGVSSSSTASCLRTQLINMFKDYMCID